MLKKLQYLNRNKMFLPSYLVLAPHHNQKNNRKNNKNPRSQSNNHPIRHQAANLSSHNLACNLILNNKLTSSKNIIRRWVRLLIRQWIRCSRMKNSNNNRRREYKKERHWHSRNSLA